MNKKITTFGKVDERSKKQLENCMIESAEYGVLCADHHPGYSMPIGGAIAYEHHISPSGVGYDIACGNKVVMTNLMAKDIEIGPKGLLKQYHRELGTLGRRGDTFIPDQWIVVQW